jgi:hypothetical protein
MGKTFCNGDRVIHEKFGIGRVYKNYFGEKSGVCVTFDTIGTVVTGNNGIKIMPEDLQKTDEIPLTGHGKPCHKCGGEIFTINATVVHKVIVDKNGFKLGDGAMSARPSLQYPFSKIKECLQCGELNKIGDWQ